MVDGHDFATCSRRTQLLDELNHSHTQSLGWEVQFLSHNDQMHSKALFMAPAPAVRMVSASHQRIAISPWQRTGEISINMYISRKPETVIVRYFWHTLFEHMFDDWLHRTAADSYTFILCSRHRMLRPVRDGRQSCCRSHGAARAPHLVSCPRAWFSHDCWLR